MKLRFLTLITAVVLLIGCGSSKKVLVPVHDTVVHTEYVTSIIHDSVDRWKTHYEYIKGDTVRIIDSVYTSKYFKTIDTMYVTDTVKESTTIIQPEVVVKSKTNWLSIIILSSLLLLSLCGYWLLYHFKKLKL